MSDRAPRQTAAKVLKIGIVAESNGAVRQPAQQITSRPRTLDAMWNLVEDLAKENAELRGSIDIMAGRLSVIEAWQPRTPGSLLEMGDTDDVELEY